MKKPTKSLNAQRRYFYDPRDDAIHVIVKTGPGKDAHTKVMQDTFPAAFRLYAASLAAARKLSPDERNAPRGSMLGAINALLIRPGGCTRKDIMRATGWPSVNVYDQAEALGLRAKVDNSRRPFRYYGKKRGR